MFSSTIINTAAPGSSNPTHHHQHQHQQPQVSSYSEVLFPDHHHHTDLVPGIVAQDAHLHDHVAIGSTISFITPFGNTTMDKQPGSVARATKKKSDKRSKIRTSQGLRDRRVRLSIDIARKFFDLQDLLGFDKPSRTVEWLLTNSSKAILDLSGASSSTTSSEAARTENGFKSLSSSRSTATCSTDRLQQAASDDSLKTMKQKVAFLTRESRERARVRARARTLAKLWTSKLHHQEIRLLNCHNFGTPSLSKASQFAVRQEEKGKEKEQGKQTQQLQIHNYVPEPNLSLDWDISSVTSLPTSSATDRLNLSRDVEIYTRFSWDQLILHDYRNL